MQESWCARRSTRSRAIASLPSARAGRHGSIRTSPIGAASLGLATLARLTYDYPSSDRLYPQLFSADLVVLSGCRTAGGVLVEGEGVQGLTAPLIQAGARSVVASQWRIGDGRTIAFVRAFYQALAEGLPVGDALRAAKLDALRGGASAREWAAFTVAGDPLVSVPLRAPGVGPWR